MRWILVIAWVAGATAMGPRDTCADPGAPERIDAATVTKRLACLDKDLLAPLGTIQGAERIGSHPASAMLQVFGSRARGYVRFPDGSGDDDCDLAPVVGRPRAWARGDFGSGVVAAYALAAPCNRQGCMTAVSFLTADKRVADVWWDRCETRVELERIRVFPDHDSLLVRCWNSAGSDPDRADVLLDTSSGEAVKLAEVEAGVAWYQLDTKPMCQARPPGGLRVVTPGASPVLDLATVATEAQVKAAGIDWWSPGGCEAAIATARYTYRAADRRFEPSGRPRISIVHHLCTCPK